MNKDTAKIVKDLEDIKNILENNNCSKPKEDAPTTEQLYTSLSTAINIIKSTQE